MSGKRSVLAGRFALAAAVLLLAGCAGLGARGGAASASYEPAEVAAAPPRAQAKASAPTARAAPAVAPSADRSVPAGAVGGAQAPAAETEGTTTQSGGGSGARLRVYTGFLELVVAEVERARARIIDAVGQMGGYVESTTADAVVVRVPAERFDAAMADFAALGEVRSRSVESADVTESYADLERRIAIATRTRARLYALLEKTTDVEERVAILREIRRLTEEIEQLGSARAALEARIALSRITVGLFSRIDEQGGGTAVPFPWIRALSPLRPSGRAAAAAVSVEIAAEYAVFESGKRVRVEAADGTRLAVGVLPNEPRGDTSFWRDAVRFHLGGLYRSQEPVRAGVFEGALLESKDLAPFWYLVAVAVRGDEILVAEAFFPNRQARERRLAGVLAMLEGVKP